MSVTIKRKRGRPRLDEPKEIQDFDHNLIAEFKKFPVFYDRQHPQHRNREYTDRIWHRIGQNLNVSSSLVKTRMVQLRNRFNLEKRRVEALHQQPNSPVSSQWSLYESLSFLGNYVKTRRPYSLPNNGNPKAISSASSSDANDDDDGVEGNAADETQQTKFLTNSMRTNGNHNRSFAVGTLPQKVHRMDNNDFGNKYKAFGQFLTSSLIELNEVQALKMVNKFTTDLVKCLKAKESKENFNNFSQSNDAVDEDDNVAY